MTDPAIVQDSTAQISVGDYMTKFRKMPKEEAAGFIAGEEEKAKIAKEGVGKAEKQAESKLIQQYGPSLYSKPWEEFKPSQESLSGFAALGSLMMVAGTMMGSKGRLAGIGAMNNIAGMLKGYQSGRKDLYEQERQQFEENMKIQERNRADIKEAFNLALKMAPTNLRGAEEFLNKTFASKGMSVPQAMLKSSGVMHTIDVVGGALDKANTTSNQIAKTIGPAERIAIAQYGAEQKALAEEGKGTLEYGVITNKDGTQEKGMFLPSKILDAQKQGGSFEKLAASSNTTKTSQMSDDAADFVANSYLDNPTAAAPLFSRLSAPDKEKVLAIAAQKAKEKNISPEDLDKKRLELVSQTAQARTLGTMAGRTAAPAAEAKMFGQYAKELSRAVPRGKFVPVNKLIQMAEENISDENLLAFRAATNTYLFEYARAITPVGATTDKAREKGIKLLSTATSQEAFDRVVDVMNKEMEYAQEALKTTIGTVTGGSPAPAAPAASVSPAAPSAPVASLKDIEFTAQKYGKTVDEIKKILRDAGRKIEGE